MKRVVLLFCLSLYLQAARSQTSYTWNGSASTAWSNPANWTPNGNPGSADNIKIVTAGNNCLLTTSTHISNITLTSGTLDLGGYTLSVDGATQSFTAGTIQNGTLNITAATTTSFGNGPILLNCATTIVSGAITLKNTTFQQSLTLTKTGSSNDNSSGGNVFNGTVTMNNTGSGYLLLGNGNPDQFNAAATFNNTGSSNLYVAYSSSNNIFGGVTTFNNATSNNSIIYISQNSTGSLFKDSVVFSSISGSGIYFGGSSAAANNLAATKTISIGAAGFTAGTLQLRAFSQTGATPQNLALTGSSTLVFGPYASFDGNLTTSSPALSMSGTTFNGSTDLTKTGPTGDWSTGNNTFNGVCSITNSGSSYLVLGNGNPDVWNKDVTFTNNGSERILPGWASVGNQFNGNIYINSSGSATGVQFCGGNNTATATLAAGKTVQAGSGGLTAGYLYLKQFTQAGNTPINVTATGTASVWLGPSSNFGGIVTVTAPDIWAQGATYNSPVYFTKTGGNYNHNNQNQNIFKASCTINQQSNTGYFMLGYNSNDLFQDTIVVTSSGTGGIYLGWTSGTGTPTLSAGKSIQTGSGGFSAGFLYMNGFTQLGNAPINLSFTGTNTYLAFARSTVIGGDLTTSSPDVYLNGATFNGLVNITKTGAGGDAGAGSNIFQKSASFTNSGSGWLILGNSYPDIWNADASFNSTGSSYIGPAWNAAGNMFNGNITVTSTNSSTGILFCNGSTGAATLAAGDSIAIGAAGFSAGGLYLRRFTQLGNASNNMNLTGSSTLLQVGPSSAFGGALSAVSPRILLNGAVFSSTVNVTKTGATGEWSSGGNTFNSTTTINQQGAGYFGFANGSPDIYNGDLYVNNNSTERVIFGGSGTGNQFNGNIILTQVGTSVGIAFGWSASTDLTQAAGKTISVGAAGFNTGYLQIERFTQLGNTPMNLPLAGTSSLVFGPTATIGGKMVSTSGSLYFNGCTFNGVVNATKNGPNSDYSSGNNIFNDSCIITNAASGSVVLGNGAADTWNGVASFTSAGSSYIAPAWNSAGNIFKGNILVSSTNASAGILFCGNSTSNATLTAGNAIQTGPTGFSSGALSLPRFTQLGNTATNLNFTGVITLLQVGPSSAIGGPLTAVSPRILLNGAVYSDVVTVTKTGATGEWSTGGNVFNSNVTINQQGGGYFGFANGAPDIYNGDVYVNNNSTERVIFGNNPTGNQFNGNIILTQVGSSQGICFGWSSTTDETQAAGKTISIGAAGFTTGYLQIQRFTQLGNTAMNLPLTGNSSLYFGPTSTIGGNLTSTSGALYFNGCTFNGTVNSTKTGASNDQSQGNNIFNAASTFTNTGTGYLLMTNNYSDAYNGDVSFVQSNTGYIYPNFNNNSVYAGNIYVTSPSSTSITFGAGSGTATLTAGSLQTINAGAGSAVPVFSKLVVNNGNNVTLNTPVNVSSNLLLTTGLVNTTTTNILTMLSGSSVASGDALSTSYINGPMRYKKSSSGVSILNFPIGNAPDCRPVTLTVNHSSGNTYYYTAQLFNASATALGYTLPPSVDVVSGVHYYIIGRTNSSNVSQPTLELSGNQQVQVYFGANDIINNGSTLTVVKNTYLNPTKWIDIGGVGGPTYSAGANLTGSITSTSSPTAFNSFSTFALGDKIGGGNVLPVGLLNFAAQADRDRVELSWTTSTESNNNYFTVEKSVDGLHFTAVRMVPTAAVGGNSAVALNYATTDPAPYPGVSFYRLKQTDLDGQSTYSSVVTVSFAHKKTMTVYPNPSSGTLHISGISTTETSLKVEWFDLSGRSLLQTVLPVQNGFATLNAPATVNNGMYTLRFTAADGTVSLQNIIIMK